MQERKPSRYRHLRQDLGRLFPQNPSNYLKNRDHEKDSITPRRIAALITRNGPFDGRCRESKRLGGRTELERDALLPGGARGDRRSGLHPPIVVLVFSTDDDAELRNSVGTAVTVFTGTANENLASLLSGDTLNAALPAWTARQIGSVWAHAVKETDVVPDRIFHAGLNA